MSIAYNTSIVRDGLVLHLDAANPKSYPGSGTTWFDLSGRVEIPLVSTVTYSTDNIGEMNFNGTSSYASISDITEYFPAGNKSHNLTVEIWVKLSNSSSTNEIFSGLLFNNDRLYFGKANGVWQFGWGSETWVAPFTGQTVPVTTNWTHYVFTVNNGVALLYINGNPSVSRTDTSVSLSGTFPIGGYFNGGAYQASNCVASKISYFSFYNMTLSKEEINQNFEALRGRYGI